MDHYAFYGVSYVRVAIVHARGVNTTTPDVLAQMVGTKRYPAVRDSRVGKTTRLTRKRGLEHSSRRLRRGSSELMSLSVRLSTLQFISACSYYAHCGQRGRFTKLRENAQQVCRQLQWYRHHATRCQTNQLSEPRPNCRVISVALSVSLSQPVCLAGYCPIACLHDYVRSCWSSPAALMQCMHAVAPPS